MIIGFDASRAFVPDKTGTENYSYQLLKALAKLDKKNKYMVYLRGLTKNPTAVGKNVNFSFRVINWPGLWTQGGLALQTFKDSLDVLFIPAHTLPLIRRPGLKTVVTVHDLGSEYLPSAHQLKQRLYLGFMQKYQLATADKIIAVSKATQKDLICLGIDLKNVTVVYEGYDKEIFRPVSAGGRGYFLFVGTVQPRKNLERLIKAFAAIAHLEGGGLRLVIAGQKGWMSEEIYKLPEKLGVEEKVKFLGYVPEKNLPALYSGAIALLFPSLFEGFGLPIIEAQACGCPVLTSNLSSMPEVAGQGAVFVNPYDIDDIVKGMIRIKNQESRIKLKKAGFENIKRFSWEKCAAQTLKVFENLKFKI